MDASWPTAAVKYLPNYLLDGSTPPAVGGALLSKSGERMPFIRPLDGASSRTYVPAVFGTAHASRFQISVAYSAMVWSLENFPALATFKIVFWAHAPGFA